MVAVRIPALWAALLVGVLLAGCRSTPQTAVAEADLAEAELRAAGSGFDVDGVRGNAVCSGTVLDEGGWFGSRWRVRVQCKTNQRLVEALRAGRRCQRGETAACRSAADIELGEAGGDRALAAQWLAVACGKQDPAACTALGRLALKGGDAAQIIQARAHLRSACDGKDGEGCWLLAQMLRGGQGGPVDTAQADALGPQACDLGIAIACRDTAERWLKAQDIQGGLGWLRKACHAKDEAACARLAALHEGADGGPVDLAAATEAQLHACHLGHAAACHRAAERYVAGKDVAAAPEVARQLLEQGCRLSSPLGCTRLAVLLAQGVGGPKDAQRAEKLWQAACEGGLGEACRHLAAAAPVVGAADIWKRACEAGDPDGCAGWAAALRAAAGTDVAQLTRAAALDRQACAMGAGRGCRQLAVAVRSEPAVQGGPAQEGGPAQAITLLQQACAAADGEGCALLGGAYERGEGTVRDPQRAAAAWKAACAAGWRQGPCSQAP